MSGVLYTRLEQLGARGFRQPEDTTFGSWMPGESCAKLHLRGVPPFRRTILPAQEGHFRIAQRLPDCRDPTPDQGSVIRGCLAHPAPEQSLPPTAETHSARLDPEQVSFRPVATGALTFVLPVRDPHGVADWPLIRGMIAETLGSLERAGGHIVVAATRGTDLPDLPKQANLVELDIPYSALPEAEGPARHAAVREDKGRRIITGLIHAQPEGHVMVVDYDAFVCHRLVALAQSNPSSNGWYVDTGYLYDGGHFVLKIPRGFNDLCGTSLIVRADLLHIPRSIDDLDSGDFARTLGSHRFLRGDLENSGAALSPTPFPGAVYRVGHRDSTSPTITLRSRYLSPRRALRHPQAWSRSLAGLRMTASIRADFGMPNGRH